jgi:hypothetical protein
VNGAARRAAGLVAGGMLGVVATLGAAQDGGRRDGGVPPRPTLDQYCRDHLGAPASAVHLGEGIDGWRCAGVENGLWFTEPIDLGDVCARHGGRSLAVDDPDADDGWTCR